MPEQISAPQAPTGNNSATPSGDSSVSAPVSQPGGFVAPPQRALSVPSSAESSVSTDNIPDAPAIVPPAGEKTLSLAEQFGESVDNITKADVATLVAATEVPIATKSTTEVPVAPTTPTAAKPSERDYTIFPAELLPVVKKLNNQQYDIIKAVIPRLVAEKAEVSDKLSKIEKSGGVLESFYQHPDAYRLIPEYQQLEQDINYITFEEQHWAGQYQALKSPNVDKVIWLTGFNPQGQPLYKEVKVTDENKAAIETQLLRNMNVVQQTKVNKENALQQYTGQVKQHYENGVAFINAAEDKYFPLYKGDKHHRVADIKEFKNTLVPAQFRNHPLAGSLAKAYAMILDMNAVVKKLQGELAAAKSSLSDRRAAGPSGHEVINGGGANGKVLDMKLFGDE